MAYKNHKLEKARERELRETVKSLVEKDLMGSTLELLRVKLLSQWVKQELLITRFLMI